MSRSTTSGFTLIELMTASTLLASMALVIGYGQHALGTMAATIESEAVASRQACRAAEFIRRELRQASRSSIETVSPTELRYTRVEDVNADGFVVAGGAPELGSARALLLDVDDLNGDGRHDQILHVHGEKIAVVAWGIFGTGAPGEAGAPPLFSLEDDGRVVIAFESRKEHGPGNLFRRAVREEVFPRNP